MSSLTNSTSFAVALILVTFAGCARPQYLRSHRVSLPGATLQAGSLAQPVILISIDGLRPDAIEAFAAENLMQLMREGSYSLTASTIVPSKTLPSHTSMLTGELPENHGILWNNKRMFSSEVLQKPTVFSVLRSKGFKTAAFFSKSKFEDLMRPGTLDYSQAPGGWIGGLIPGRWSADRTVQDVTNYLKTERPDLLFVHFGDVDYAGHRSGWMTKSYGNAVRKVDLSIAQLRLAADEAYGSYTVIITSDHGGHNRDHGSDHPLDVTIPWIAWGSDVIPGRIAEHIDTMDTASTVLWLFGTDEPTDWAGSPIKTAFQRGIAAPN